MKLFLVSIFLNFIILQTTSYTGGTIEYSINGKTKPLGKNVTVKYDSFFKSYVITYKDINGIKHSMTFEYEEDSRFTYNYVEYYCFFAEMGLEHAKFGNGYITFDDLRKSIYGGTGQSFKIKNLSISK